MTTALAAAAMGLALLAGASPAVEIDQIGAPGAGLGELEALQVGERVRRVEPAEPPPPPAPVDQLNTEPRPRAIVAEQPPVAGLDRNAQQLNTQRASAEAPAGPEVPFPRKTTLEPVSGDDQCDPRAQGADQRDICANRIEQRAAEFAPPPEREVSLEERLLADRPAAGSNADAAARRSAEGGFATGDVAQAYVFTSGSAPTPADAGPSISPETQRAMDAAAQLLGGLPANAIVTPR